MEKAKLIVQEKIKTYQTLAGDSFETVERQIADGYKVVLPVEMYQSYQAYNSSSINFKKAGYIDVDEANKSTSLYYQPVIDKEFDFVINSTILEPVIQVMYEVKVKINREKATTKKIEKEYILVTPTGELKSLNLK